VRGHCEWGSHFGKGGAGSPRREQGASVKPRQGKREDVRRRQEDKDDPRMVSRCQHAQSKLTCIAQGGTSECVNEGVIVVLIVSIVSGKLIIWCQYHLYSSSDVRSRVRNNSFSLAHRTTGSLRTTGRGQRSGQRRATERKADKSRDLDSRKLTLTVMLDQGLAKKAQETKGIDMQTKS
jgi:hypothetical protein